MALATHYGLLLKVPMTIRILIADDHEVVRASLKALLLRSEFEVVGEACNGKHAIDLVEACSPDVVLLDVVMPELDGVGSLEQIKASHPELPVLMYSFSENDHYRQQCKLLGAADYLVKGISGRELLASLRAATTCVLESRPSLPDQPAEGFGRRPSGHSQSS